MSRLISFAPTCSLLLTWQASPTCNIESSADNPMVSTPYRLHSSEIPKPLSVDFVVIPPPKQQPALSSLIGGLPQKQYYFWQRKLAQLVYIGVSPFCTRSGGLVLNLKAPSIEYMRSLASSSKAGSFIAPFLVF